MSAIIIFTAVAIAQLMLAAAMAIVSVRMFRGPRAQDSGSSASMHSISTPCCFSSPSGSGRAGDLFRGRTGHRHARLRRHGALAKFLMRGEVIE